MNNNLNYVGESFSYYYAVTSNYWGKAESRLSNQIPASLDVDGPNISATYTPNPPRADQNTFVNSTITDEYGGINTARIYYRFVFDESETNWMDYPMERPSGDPSGDIYQYYLPSQNENTKHFQCKEELLRISSDS